MAAPDEYARVQEAAAFLRERIGSAPDTAVVLGSGLGGFTARLGDPVAVGYAEIPHWPVSNVVGHAGTLVIGNLGGRRVAALSGRAHYYEGHPAQRAAFPTRVVASLGVRVLLLTNAAGGINLAFKPGTLMIIDDHINLMGLNPLIGPNDDRLGPRFPDLIEPYDRDLQKRALQIALEENIVAHRGVYVAVPGPNLETRAEYRYLRAIGADVVGMSTVPEVLVAVHAGLKVLGFSIVTDLCLPDALEPALIEEILAVARTAEGKLRILVRRILETLDAPAGHADDE